jgi:hypothetical protein
MNTTTVCCPAVTLPSTRAWWQREWLDALSFVQRWKQRSRERAEWRALEGLSEQTRRDIGLAERLPSHPPTLGLLDYERGRWS